MKLGELREALDRAGVGYVSGYDPNVYVTVPRGVNALENTVELRIDGVYKADDEAQSPHEEYVSILLGERR